MLSEKEIEKTLARNMEFFAKANKACNFEDSKHFLIVRDILNYVLGKDENPLEEYENYYLGKGKLRNY